MLGKSKKRLKHKTRSGAFFFNKGFIGNLGELSRFAEWMAGSGPAMTARNKWREACLSPWKGGLPGEDLAA
jgi:hypothetical protein